MRGVGIVIRLDDISPLMDIGKFKRFENIMDRHNLPAVLGAIPYHFRKEKISKIADMLHELEYKGWEIAQHGYTRESLSNNSGLIGLKKASEFAGLPYELQRERILKGKEIMRENGFCPITFIAPWNSYDKNTIRALADGGFKIVSANRLSFGINSKILRYFLRMAQRKLAKDYGILLIPQQFADVQIFLASKRREFLLNLVLAMRLYKAMTFCYHLTSEFEGLPKFLDTYSPYIVTCKDILQKTH